MDWHRTCIQCTRKSLQHYVRCAKPLQKRRVVLSSERKLPKDYDHKGSVAKQICGHEPQGTWCQDELSVGKAPDIESQWLWLTVTLVTWEKVCRQIDDNCRSWCQGHFGTREEVERPLLKAATKQRLVKTEDFLCVVVTVIFGACNSVSCRSCLQITRVIRVYNKLSHVLKPCVSTVWTRIGTADFILRHYVPSKMFWAKSITLK
jgi:hypothetical protein